MIRPIAHVQRSSIVDEDAIAISKLTVAGSATSRPSDACDRRTTRSIARPHLDSIVRRIENIDRSVGDKHARRLLELVGGRAPARSENGGGIGRVGLNDDDSVVALIGDVQSRIIDNVDTLV